MRVVVAVVLLVACGRVGFDGSGDGGTDDDALGDGATTDAPGSPFMVELPAQSTITDLALLPDGGVIAVGGRAGSLTLDGITDPGVGAFDMVIISLDENGHARWLHQYGGTENDVATTVAIAPDGSIYVGGIIQNNASLGGPTLPGTNLDAYVVKYTPTGEWVWDRRFGGVEDIGDHADAVLDIAVRGDGEVFVAGRVAGDVDFGLGNTVASPAENDAFVARYSPTGVPRWAKRYGELDVNAFTSLAVTNDTIYLGGYYSGTPDLGTGPLPDRGANEALMLRMDASNNAIAWIANFGGSDNQRIYGVTLHDNTLVGTGYYWNTVDVPTVTTAAQRADGIVVSLDVSNGAFTHAYRYGGANCDFLFSAHVADDQVVASGTFQDTVMLDTAVSTVGLTDSIAFGIDGDGFQWHRSFGDNSDEVAESSVGGLSTALYIGGSRGVQLDTGCNTILGATTGYIRRF